MGSKEMLISRTSSQRIELANKFLQSMRDSNIFCLILDENLLKKSYKEQMDLIDKYIELGKDTNVYSIIINPSEKTVTRILIEIKQYLEIGIIRQQKTKNVIFTKDECIDVNDNKGINLVKRIKT